jgi:hypothetical protein
MSNAMLRDLAVQCGLGTFLGTPCRACGCKERYARDRYHCVKCHRERSKQYNRIHRDEVNQNTREWAADNAEYIKNVREAKR